MPTDVGFRIPEQDREFYANALGDQAKAIIETWQRIVAVIRMAPTEKAGIQECAAMYQHLDGFSEDNIGRKYYDWKRSGNWRVFLNKKKLKKAHRDELSRVVITLWKKKCEENQRGCKQAYNEFIAEIRATWARGGFYPGLGSWLDQWKLKHRGVKPPAECPSNFIPKGCTYSNLMEQKPSKYELKCMRIGRAAAADLRPLVFTTRVGMEVGQYRLFDDLFHDNKVNVFGRNRAAQRPLELSCLDVFSAHKEVWGIRPTLEADDGKKDMLKAKEMLWVLAELLINHGYRPAGTILGAEMGTAAITERIERLLYDWTDGMVRVARNGIQGDPVFAGMFHGKSKGNFRFKAPLESQHNLAHNMLAALPGQMGKDRNHSPEELHGRDAYNTSIIKAIAEIPAERAIELRFPVLEFSKFLQLAMLIYERMAWRTDHNLEGWVRAGLIQELYVPGPGFEPIKIETILALGEEKAAPILHLMAKAPDQFTDRRKLAPQEVYDRGVSRLIRLPHWRLPLIFGRENAISPEPLVVPHDRTIEIDHEDLGPDTVRYTALMERADGGEEMLAPGDKFLGFVNPFNRSHLYVCTEDMKVRGRLKEWATVSRMEMDAIEPAYGRPFEERLPIKQDAIHAQQGAAAHFEKRLRAGIEERHAGKARDIAAMKAHNKLLLSGKPVTAEEKQRERALAKFEGPDLAEPEEPATAAVGQNDQGDMDVEQLL